MAKRVLIGASIVLLIALIVFLCTIFFKQSIPMEGTLV